MCFNRSDTPFTAAELTRKRQELLSFLNDPEMPGASKAEAIAALFNLLQIARSGAAPSDQLTGDFRSTDPADMS